MLEYIYIGILILFSIISKLQNNSKFGEIKECSLQRIIKICYRINKSRYRSLPILENQKQNISISQ